MDTMRAFLNAEANRDKEPMVFDWLKAAELIKKHKPDIAIAGLAGDFEWTGGEIYNSNGIVPREDTYCYLQSNWARPMLILDGKEFECFVMKSETEWNQETYWPENAKALLEEKE